MEVSLEERVALLEAEVALLKALSESPDVAEPRWWEKIAGTFRMIRLMMRQCVWGGNIGSR